MVVHIFNHSTWEAEAGRSEFEASLVYIGRLFLKERERERERERASERAKTDSDSGPSATPEDKDGQWCRGWANVTDSQELLIVLFPHHLRQKHTKKIYT